MKPTDPHDAHHDDAVAHEHSDINVRAVVLSAVVIAAVCSFTAVLMYVLQMYVLEPMAQARDPQMSPLALPATNMPRTTLESPKFGSAPEPRLMTNEPMNLQELRQHTSEQLTGYAWVNQAAGVARIPIDEAKKLVLERGLPVRAEPIADPRFGTHAPAYGESSSGRAITNPPTAPPAAPAPAATEHKAPEQK
ncbi:MAG TPA: hypothetical protein VH740_15685 [Vicinamibacterales bacterium]|jgi:hypothetical protein